MLEGSCHCGAVRWRQTGDPGSVTACNCTICRRSATLWACDDEGERVTVSGTATAYAWGDRSIRFPFYPICGSGAGCRSREVDAQGRRRIAVNLRLAQPEAVAARPIDPFNGACQVSRPAARRALRARLLEIAP